MALPHIKDAILLYIMVSGAFDEPFLFHAYWTACLSSFQNANSIAGGIVGRSTMRIASTGHTKEQGPFDTACLVQEGAGGRLEEGQEVRKRRGQVPGRRQEQQQEQRVEEC